MRTARRAPAPAPHPVNSSSAAQEPGAVSATALVARIVKMPSRAAAAKKCDSNRSGMSAAPVWRATGCRYLQKRRLGFDKVDLWGQFPASPPPQAACRGRAGKGTPHVGASLARPVAAPSTATGSTQRPAAASSRTGVTVAERSSPARTPRGGGQQHDVYQPAGRPGKVDERGDGGERAPLLPSRPGRRGRPQKNTKPTKLRTQKLVRLSRQGRPGMPAERQGECSERGRDRRPPMGRKYRAPPSLGAWLRVRWATPIPP